MLTELRSTLDKSGLGFVVSILYIILAFALAKILSVLLNRAYKSFLSHRAKTMAEDRKRRLETAGTLVVSIGRYILFFIAFAISLGELGLSNAMNSMLAAAGIGGIAIGIGAQSLIKDIVTGFFILFEDQFSVGDFITIDDITGTVERIELRTTSVRGFRGELNVIPNGSVSAMTNYSRSDYLAFIDMPVEHEADVQKAMECMREEALSFAKQSTVTVGDPEMLGIIEVKDTAVIIRMIQKVQPLRHWGVQRELTKQIMERFDREGIRMSKLYISTSGDKA